MFNQEKPALSRRDFLRLLGVGAAGAALGACAPKAVQTALVPTPVPPTPTTAEPEGQIVIWDRSGDLFQVFDSAISTFNKKYPKITIKHEAVDINAKLATTLTAGVDVPDGTFIEDVNIPPLAEFFTDITEWIQPYIKDIVPFKARVNTYNGEIIGIPFDLDPSLLYYREDLLKNAGVDPASLKTYDDLIPAAKTIQEKLGSDKKPIHIERASWAIPLQLEMFANQQDTSLVNEKGELQLNSDPYLKALKWVKNVLDNGVGSLQEYTSPGDVQALDTDQVAFYPWAIWFVYAPENLLKASKGKWRAMPLPAWTPDGARGANMGGSSFVIPKQSKNPRLAWLFYEYLMLNPEGYKAVYGPNKIYPGGLNTSLPSYLPAQKEQLFENPQGLGGQNLWEVAVSTVKDIPANYYYASWYGQAADIIAANVQRMQDGQLSPEDALKNSADDITSRIINR
jgi:lactose/L-arabinose transport system substrate-binding protein